MLSVDTRLSNTFSKGKRGPWHVFPLTIGAYSIENFKEAHAKAKQINGFCFIDLGTQNYEPGGIATSHYKEVGFGWAYKHEKKLKEDKVKKFYNASTALGQNEKQGEQE